jgi:hypothetical protein
MSMMKPSTIVLALAFVLLAALTSCDSGANQQFLPIGQRCDSAGDCGTPPFGCALTNYPGGYCEKDCTVDMDCPADSVCAGTKCRRSCVDSTKCRFTEGYACVTRTASSPYCDIP